jgi:tRNA(adenine34) deaminase
MCFSSQMDLALAEAEKAAAVGEVPVGAVIVDPKGTVIASASNRTRRDSDPTAHAEILAIRKAAKFLGNHRLVGCTIYVTLEPCAMCAGALSHARVAQIIYGAPDPKSGGTDHGARVFEHSQTHHRPEVLGGISEAACSRLISNFFHTQRAKS